MSFLDDHDFFLFEILTLKSEVSVGIFLDFVGSFEISSGVGKVSCNQDCLDENLYNIEV